MRQSKRILFTLLLLAVTGSVVAAKTNLPVSVDCSQSGGGNAKVVVKFLRPANAVTVTVSGTGSVEMEKAVRQSATISKDGTLVVDVPYTAGANEGGLAIFVTADFGKGSQSQATSYRLVQATSEDSVRAKSGTNQGTESVIVLPAKTTVKP